MTAEVLRLARKLYAANPSHAPADVYPESGCECPITALAMAQMDTHAPNEVWLAAHAALAIATGCEEGLPRWNAEHTTEEVLAAFDRAIEAVS